MTPKHETPKQEAARERAEQRAEDKAERLAEDAAEAKAALRVKPPPVPQPSVAPVEPAKTLEQRVTDIEAKLGINIPKRSLYTAG